MLFQHAQTGPSVFMVKPWASRFWCLPLPEWAREPRNCSGWLACKGTNPYSTFSRPCYSYVHDIYQEYCVNTIYFFRNAQMIFPGCLQLPLSDFRSSFSIFWFDATTRLVRRADCKCMTKAPRCASQRHIVFLGAENSRLHVALIRILWWMFVLLKDCQKAENGEAPSR